MTVVPEDHVEYDVLVVGAGLAGLHLAGGLAERGHSVLLCDRRSDVTTSIRTTGIFVRRTLDDFDLPERLLGPAIRRVNLYPPGPGVPIELASDRDEYRVGDVAGIYAAALADARGAGVEVRLGTSYVGPCEDEFVLRHEGRRVVVSARFIVGADGARSAVARDLGLDSNTDLLVGAEDVLRATHAPDSPIFHCVLDPVLAPGYLAWVVNDGTHVHVGTAGYPRRFPRGPRHALADFRALAPGLNEEERQARRVERRGGAIPVGGLLRRISSGRGLLIGDAAGAVSPLTAGGLDPCLRLSDYAVECLDEALTLDDPAVLTGYDGAFLRQKFAGRVAMRAALARVRRRTVMTAGFALLRTPPGRWAAEHIMFADRSFPDAPKARKRGSNPRGSVLPVARSGVR